MAKKKAALAIAWKAVSKFDRSMDCLMWLWLRDEITDSEFERAKLRLKKKYEKEPKA